MKLWNWRGIDVINAHERDSSVCLKGIRDAIDNIEHELFNPSAVYTHLMPLEDLSKGFELITSRPPGFFKALIMMEGEA